jgi:CheY-like chemotaxis protein
MPARRLLIVDDDDDTRQSLQELMIEEGFEVAVARSGAAALSDLTHGRVEPQAIIADMRMPSMSGGQFLASMRKNPAWSRIPVILCSAGGVDASASDGAFAIVQKPFDVEELLEVLQRAIAHGVTTG